MTPAQLLARLEAADRLREDERAGIAWWNALSVRERGQRLTLANGLTGNPTVAECWRIYKIIRDNAHLDRPRK